MIFLHCFRSGFTSVFWCNLESFNWTIGTSQHVDRKKVWGNCPKNWLFLKCHGKNPQKSYFDKFCLSESKSGLSLAPKCLDLPILNWSGLAVPDCTLVWKHIFLYVLKYFISDYASVWLKHNLWRCEIFFGAHIFCNRPKVDRILFNIGSSSHGLLSDRISFFTQFLPVRPNHSLCSHAYPVLILFKLLYLCVHAILHSGMLFCQIILCVLSNCSGQ